MYHLYRCHASKSVAKPGIHKTYDSENVHTIMCMYAHLSAEIMEKSSIQMQLFTVIHPHPGCKGKGRLKAEIQTYFKAQKPWQGSLLLATTDFFKNTSRNTPKLSWLQERNKPMRMASTVKTRTPSQTRTLLLQQESASSIAISGDCLHVASKMTVHLPLCPGSWKETNPRKTEIYFNYPAYCLPLPAQQLQMLYKSLCFTSRIRIPKVCERQNTWITTMS